MGSRVAFGILFLFVFSGRPLASQSVPTATPTSGEGPLSVTFSPNDPNGSLYQWQFNFIVGSSFAPDYSSESGEDVTFTYQAPGTYVARLRVYDATTGASSDRDVTITVFPPPSPPVVNLTAGSNPTAPGVPIQFAATAAASPGRTVTNYFWDLNNDGAMDVSSPGGPSASITSSYVPFGFHRVSVTATDNGGLASTATVDVKISQPPNLSIPQPWTRLAAPGIPARFDASATASAGPFVLESYAWDFGDGTTATSPAGPTASVLHTFASPGTYTVTVTAFETAGFSSTQGLTVTVTAPPAILALQHQGSTNVTVMAFPPPGNAVSVYRWDFLADGSINATSSPGTAETGYASSLVPPIGLLTVTANFTPSSTSLQTTIQVRPVLSRPIIPPLPPQVAVALTASADGSPPSGGPINIRVGHVVTFTADVVSLDGQTLRRVLWDFDGDGLRDQTDELSALNSLHEVLTAPFQFQTPGTFVVSAKGIVDLGTAQDTVTVNVAPATAPLECWIAQPRNGKKIWGNHVSVHARVAPALFARRVDFQYRRSGSGNPWNTFGSAVPPPYSSLSAAWDVTRLAPGDYDLRARAQDTSGSPPADSETLQTVRVTVDPLTPDEQEDLQGSGPIVRVHTIDPSGPTRTEIARDTALEIPAQALLGRATVRMERPFGNPHPLEARFQGLNFISGSFRRLSLADGATLQQPSRISLYDLNPNGALDGLNVDKTKLKIYQFDDVKQQWAPLFSQVVQPREDLVRATLVSMGDVGLVVDPLSRQPSDSSGDSCGALGAEFLLLPLVLFALRSCRRAADRR